MACKVLGASPALVEGNVEADVAIGVGGADADFYEESSGLTAEKVCSRLCQAIEAVEAYRPTSFVTDLNSADSSDSFESGVHEASDELRRRLIATHRVLKASAIAADQDADEDSTESGDGSGPTPTRNEGCQLLSGLLLVDVPARLVACMPLLGFEARKDAMRLFKDLLRYGQLLGASVPLVNYFSSHRTMAELLLEGSGSAVVFAYCNEMLRDFTRYPELVGVLLEMGAWRRLIDLARHEHFEISTEAFATLREVLLVNKEVVVEQIMPVFDAFFEHFHLRLLAPETDYVVKRQAAKLLADILLDRAFAEVMVSYVAEDQYLPIHMNSLLDTSRSIQLGAFHIFKVFAANPRKTRRVHSILYKNRVGLLKILATFSAEAAQDEVLAQDLATVKQILEELQAPAPKRTPSDP